MLILHNNRISRIGANIGNCLPNLKWLILNGNRIGTLQDLDPLRNCKSLTHLSLIGNPVVNQKNYREYLVSIIPKLRVLDFKKISLFERKEAKRLFGDAKPTTFVPGEVESNSTDLTKEQIQLIMDAIKKSTTTEEVQAYKQALATGQMPPNLVHS